FIGKAFGFSASEVNWHCRGKLRIMSTPFVMPYKTETILSPTFIKAALLILLSELCLVLSGASIRYIADELSIEMIVFVRNLFGLFLLLPWLCYQGVGRLKTAVMPLH